MLCWISPCAAIKKSRRNDTVFHLTGVYRFLFFLKQSIVQGCHALLKKERRIEETLAALAAMVLLENISAEKVR